jgi:hypothetical protein
LSLIRHSSFVIFRAERVHSDRTDRRRHHYHHSRWTGSEHSWLRPEEGRAPAPKRKSPPCLPPAKATKRTTEFILPMRRRPNSSTQRHHSIPQTTKQLLNICMVSLLVIRILTVFQTQHRHYTCSSSQTCSARTTLIKCIRAIRLEIRTVTLQKWPPQEAADTIQHLICGALLEPRRRQRPLLLLRNKISGSKTGSTRCLFAMPSALAARKIATRRRVRTPKASRNRRTRF